MTMRSFTPENLALSIPVGLSWLLGTVMEHKGRQELFEHQKPAILATLRQIAIIQSTESSNRIEGVTVEPGRLEPLVLGKTRPKDRSEEEIVGYRKALAWIHDQPRDHRRIARSLAPGQGGRRRRVFDYKRSGGAQVEPVADAVFGSDSELEISEADELDRLKPYLFEV